MAIETDAIRISGEGAGAGGDDIALVRSIARGGPFDVADAIRALARLVGVADTAVDTRPQLAQLDQKIREILIAAGLGTEGAVRSASDEVILALDGIGPKALATIREKVG